MFRPTNPTVPPDPAGQPPDPRAKQTYLPPSIEKAMEEHQKSAGEIDPAVQPLQPTQPQPQVISPTAPGQGPAGLASANVQYPGQPVQPSQSPDQPYDFITNPPPPPKKSLMTSLPGSGSALTRAALVIGGLLVLIIIFSVFKGILSSGNKSTTAALLSVAQDQQEMIHVATESVNQSLSDNHENFSATLQASMGSTQAQLINYMVKNNLKIKTTQLGLKISTTTDKQLAAAAAAQTFDQTFQSVMQAQLNNYGKDIQQAYKLEKGKKGRALLQDSYHQAELLNTQLVTPDS